MDFNFLNSFLSLDYFRSFFHTVFAGDDEQGSKRRRKTDILFDYLNEKANKDYTLANKRVNLDKDRFEEMKKERGDQQALDREKFEEGKTRAREEEKRQADELQLRKQQLSLEEKRLNADVLERKRQAEQAQKKDDSMFSLMQKMLERLN